MDLTVRDLRMVVAIATAGTLTRAARSIGITQSGMSQRLLDLEDRLGRPLFARTRRRMLLTDTGVAFLRDAEQVLGQLDRMEASLAQRLCGGAGTLRITADNILCYKWLPAVMGRFRAMHPRVRLELRREPEPMRALAEGRIDVAITYPREPDRRVDVVPLFDDEMLAVLPPRHPLTVRGALEAADFAGQDLIYHMPLEGSVLYRRFLAPNGIELASFTLVEQPDAILELIAAGLGIGLLPSWSVEDRAAAGAVAVARLRGDRLGVPVSWAAAVPRRDPVPFVAAFVDLVREVAAARGPGRAG